MSKSDLSKKGEANKIYYSWGNAENSLLQKSINGSGIALKIEDLLHSFRNGLADCFKEIYNDQEWKTSFENKAKDLFISIDSNHQN